MSRALFLTAFDRPELFERTMRSWEVVRGVQDWPFEVRIEPGPRQDQMTDIALQSLARMSHPQGGVTINERCYGVLHHPWVGFTRLFELHDFVLRAEDDLCVADDILEYVNVAEQAFRDQTWVGSVHCYNDGPGSDPAVLRTVPTFPNPWVWGTWRDRWEEVISPTWDHNYSTYTDSPGNESGWDWNLNRRVYPKYRMYGVVPEMSRVDNIGVTGIHGTAENFRTAETFHPHYERQEFWIPELHPEGRPAGRYSQA